jgi:hypothetical protein
VCGNRLVAAPDNSLNDLNENRISRATLTFNDQKNAVRGEQISHSATNHPRLCPCKALARLCAHLRAHNSPANTPIHAYYDSHGRLQNISPHIITNALRHAATALRQSTGIDPLLLSARSLRPGGATALLCAGIDADVIQLLGRWKSDAMLRYLRVAAHAHNSNLAQQMLQSGNYTFAPNTYTAAHAQPVPEQAPTPFVTALHREGLYYD